MSKNQRAPFLVFCMVAVLCGFVMVATARGDGSRTPQLPLDGRAYATELIERTPLGRSLLLEPDPADVPWEAPAEDGAGSVVDATDGSLAAGEPPMTAVTGGGSVGEWSAPDATSGRREGRAPAASGAGSPADQGASAQGTSAQGTSDQGTSDQGPAGSGSGSTGGAGGADVGDDSGDGSSSDGDGSAEGPDPAQEPGPAPAAPWTPGTSPVKGGTPTAAPDGAGDDGAGDEGPSVGGSPAPPPAPAAPAVPTLPIVPPAPPIVCEPRVEEEGPTALPVEPVEPAAPVAPVEPAEPAAPAEPAVPAEPAAPVA